MKRLYGFDKPHWEAYLIWLGVLPRETEFRQIRFLQNESELAERIRLPNFHIAQLDWNQDGYIQRNEVPEHLSRYIDFDRLDRNLDDELDGMEASGKDAWIEGAREKVTLIRGNAGEVKIAKYNQLLGNWKVRMRKQKLDALNAKPVAELYMTQYEGVFQGNFGQSTRYGEPVLRVIGETLPVSTILVCLLLHSPIWYVFPSEFLRQCVTSTFPTI